MRILFALHQFFPNCYTGTERLVLNLSKQLQRMGHFVKVLTYGISEKEGFKQDKSGFLIKEYEYQGIPVISIRHPNTPAGIDFDIFEPDEISVYQEEMLSRLVFKDKFDIVHVCHPMRVGTVIRVAKQKQIPVVLTLTDFWLICSKGIAITNDGQLCINSDNGNLCLKKCYSNIYKDTLKRRASNLEEICNTAACLVSPTVFLKQVFEHNNCSANKKIIPFGVDYKHVQQNLRTYSANSRITLGFLSTLTEHKGAHVLLNAFNKVKADNLRLKIYGDHFGNTDYYNILKNIARDNRRIEFFGAYKYEDMAKIFNEIDVAVMPSVWWENSPLVLLRTLAHNVPVIVSKLGGLTEIVQDGRDGFHFEAGNAQDLAKVLQNIANNPAILNEIKNKMVLPPRIEEEAFEYEKMYEALIAKR